MQNEGLVDKRAYLNVLGCILQDPSLLDDIDRPLDRSDFKTDEHLYELIYVASYNLYIQGCEKLDEFSIDSYLSNYPAQYKIFQDNHGLDYIVNAKEIASMPTNKIDTIINTTFFISNNSLIINPLLQLMQT